MIIRDVLSADWNVDRIEVTVREKESTRYIMSYCIGRDVEAGRSQHFAYETEIGDVYDSSGMKTLFIPRIIQFRQLPKKPQGKEMCVGVLEKEIPVEILNLPVESMYPYHCGYSDEMHGYHFECYTDAWSGIPGENKQIEFTGLN